MDRILVKDLLQGDEILLEKEDNENAIFYLNKTEDKTFEIDTYIGLGIRYIRNGEYENALNSFQKALSLDKGNGEIYFHIGNVYILMDDKGKGIQNYNFAISKGYDNPRLYYNMGRLYEDDGDKELAIRNFTIAIHKDPIESEYRIRKARIEIKEKQYLRALETLDKMIEDCPDVYEGYHLKFIVLNLTEKYDEAEILLEKTRTLFPNELRFELDLATLYISKKQYQPALDKLEEIENKGYDMLNLRNIFMERARIYTLMNDMSKAIYHLNEAKKISLEKHNDVSEENYFLMICYINNNEYEQAIRIAKELKRSEEFGTYKVSAYYLEPYCLKQLKRDLEAKSLFRAGVEALHGISLKYPNNIDSYIYRALCLNELEEYEKALELTDFLLKAWKNIREVYAVRSIILSTMGRKEEVKARKK